MRLRAGLLACLLACLFLSIGFGQVPLEGPPVPLALGSSAGIRSFKTDRWGVVGLDIANPRDRAVEVEATFFFSGAQEVQFGRRLWVPPHARRIAHCPVIPADDRYETGYEIRNVLYEIHEDGKRELLKDMGGELQRSMLLPKNTERLVSAMFPPMPDETIRQTSLPTAYEALLAMRLTAGMTRRVSEIARPNFPDQLHYLDAVDHIIIHNESPFSDAATTATLRQWVQRGGRLWVMLDQAPFDEVAAMFGDAFRCSLVDRVELTEVNIVAANTVGETPRPLTFERPVDMVRVEVDDVDVLYTVDDWPAAFIQHVGLGRVLYTTLSPPAWVRRTYSDNELPADPTRRSNWVSGPALDDLTGVMLDAPELDQPRDAGLNRYVAERVGYRIVERRPVLIILLSYVGALGVCGVVLLRRHAAGKLVWLAPILIVAAATPIAALAVLTKQRVPRTSSSIQIVQVSPTGQEAHVHGKMAIFLKNPDNVAISGQGSEAFLTQNWGREDAIRQLLWTDYDRWSWNNLLLTGGIKMAELDKPVRLEKPIRARVSFGPNGLVGELDGEWSIQDAQVHVSSRRGLALQVDGQKFTGDAGDILAKDQYIAGSLLSDEQRRRQILVRELTREQPERLYSSEPTLLFWTDPLPVGIDLPDDVEQSGAALVRIPLRIQRPPANSSFVIPSTFLPFRTVAGPTGKGAASTYHHALGEWVAMSTSSETWLRVQLPPQVLPAQLDKLVVRLHMDAPSRPLEIAAARDNTSVVIEHRDNPSGVLEVEITDKSVMKLDADGGVLLGIVVGPSSSESIADPEWRIYELQLTAHASR